MASTYEELDIPAGARAILKLIRDQRANTRRDLGRMSGLSRSTLAQRLAPLVASDLVIAGEDIASMGGRPASSLIFNPRAGYVLVADCGATHTHTGIADLDGQVLIREQTDIPIALGPEEVLTWLEAKFEEQMDAIEIDRACVWGIGIGLPGPVEHVSGRPVSPPIMPGWDGYAVADRLAKSFGVVALVDNDVNIMALGEHRNAQAGASNMIFVKVSTGIGSGLILSDRIHRGEHGAAGDIGHIYVPGHDSVLCNCGNIGCLEAVASGEALAQMLSSDGGPHLSVGDLVARTLHGDAEAVAAVREAGREIGSVLAALVNITDPEVIVIGGQLSEAGQPLIAGIREVVYRRSVPLATHNLQIVKTELGEHAGIIGAAVMVVEHLLSPDGSDLTAAQAIAA